MILPQRHAVARPNRNDTFPAPRPSPTALLNSPQRVNAGYSLFFSLQFSARESLHPRPLTISLETEPPSDGRHLTLRAGTPTKLPTRNGVPSRQKNTQKKSKSQDAKTRATTFDNATRMHSRFKTCAWHFFHFRFHTLSSVDSSMTFICLCA